MLRRSRVLLVSVIAFALVLYVHKNYGTGSALNGLLNDGSLRGAAKKILEPETLEGDELADLTRLINCPVCFGRDACEEVARPDVEISGSLFSADRKLEPVHQVYQGRDVKYWLRPLESSNARTDTLRALEQTICKSAGRIKLLHYRDQYFDTERLF